MPRKNFWEANITVIRRLYPGLAEELDREQDRAFSEDDIRIEEGPSGALSLTVNGIHIHSPRDPLREAQRAAETLEKPADVHSAAGEPIVLMGFGLGYAAEAAAAKAGERVLIVVERRPEIFRKALECRDLGSFLKNNRLIFTLGGGGDALINALSLLENAGKSSGRLPFILKNRALFSLDREWYTELERKLRSWASRAEINAATLARFGKRWVRNLSRNREAIRALPGISYLEGILRGAYPVFLAAAGPSLDKAGPLLADIAERCLTIAVDTSLRFLLERGIEPDFTLVVDPQFWNARHLDRAPAPKSCLIAESAVYPSVLSHPFAGTFLCSSVFPLGRYIEERVEAKGRLGAGGSVATTAWDFARYLGASSVWIAGLDLSFPELKTHFKGAVFEERAHTQSRRFVPAETFSVRSLLDGVPFRAASAGGKADGEAGGSGGATVLTDKRLSLYAAWFESRFRQFHNVKNFRLFPEGLAIAGLENGRPEDLLALPVRRPGIDALLEETFVKAKADFHSPEKTGERAKAYEKALSDLRRGLEEIKNLAEKGGKTAEAGRGAPHSAAGQNEVLGELDRLNRSIQESTVRDIAGFLLPDTADLEKRLNTPPEKAFLRHLEFSVLFYRGLEEAARYNLDELGKHTAL
ncbi:MAG: DUF115 domain-containing protein [Treponema sp.]|jgi:hypothetical protein|nr:DUF115 domain-containing protein [Treponema sp.]